LAKGLKRQWQAALSGDRKKKTRGDRPSKFSFEALEPRIALAAAGLVPVGSQPDGALSGKIVFTSPGHGWQWSDTLGRYATDRGDNNEVVEDFGNQDQMTAYADYLLRAGATVVPMRPVGRQTNEVVLDNDSPGVTFSGSWANSTSTKYYDEDYGVGAADAVPYRSATTVTGAETATATYTPNIPAAGFYPVYTWVLSGSNRTLQTYRVIHTGGTTEITVDHSLVGNGWVYLGTYHFDTGSSATLGSVQITNQAGVAGKAVIADAIRFGNGIGDSTVSGGPSPSGYPREDEDSWHWIARSIGVGTSLATAIGSGVNNVSAPSNFAEYMYNGPFGGALYMGIHSNAGGGRGARGLYTTSTTSRTPNQVALALLVGNQINQDMQALNGVFEFNWTTGTANEDHHINFGEIDLGADAEMDATIAEVAFHDDPSDAAIMRDPKGRDQIARSLYQATLQYFSTYGSPATTNVSLPTPPVNVSAVSNASGQVTVSWAAGPTTPASVNGAAATGYRIYASTDGYGFDGGTFISGGSTTTATLNGYDPHIPYYFRVVAVNAGGESKPSEVLAVLPSGGEKQVLIVSGFDRFDRTEDFRYPYLGQAVDRVWPRYNNSFDYVVQVQTALQATRPGMHVASTSNEAVISGAVNLADYDTVVWVLGEESAATRTFDATEQAKVEQFIAGGGNLFVSGSEIAWDLDSQNNGRAFFENTLKANYVADDANTYTASAVAGGIFAGLPNLSFSNGAQFSSLDGQLYNVDFPDVIGAQLGAQLALNYSGGSGGGAAIQVSGTGGRGDLVLFGFPFESITTAANRTAVMDRVLTFFNAAPAVEIEMRINGLDADSSPGPTLAASSLAMFTYVVSNTGNIPLESIEVVDDNGTPGNAADDSMPVLQSGDLNANGVLDVGETWTYLAARMVPPGLTTVAGTVSADARGEQVTDRDIANFFGSAPAIAIETTVNGQNADTPPGPTLSAGGTVQFSYAVSNTGNVPLSSVVVVDDNGTPGNSADNFNPTFTSGDANGNSLLDVEETWIYSAQRTIVTGEYLGTATAVALDDINQFALSNDSIYYAGSAASSADFNGDGVVDGADFLAWQRGLGSTGGGAAAGDANGDNAVDAADLGIWRAQFGGPPLMSDAVERAAPSVIVAEQLSDPAGGALTTGVAWTAQWSTLAQAPRKAGADPLCARDSAALSLGYHGWRRLADGVLTSWKEPARLEQPTSSSHLAGDLPSSAIDKACELSSGWSWPGLLD
jgi:N-acetylmuramoyl-L-alanine amidase